MNTSNEMKKATVLVKVSGLCPLNCTYCYAGDSSRRVIDGNTVANMIRIIENRIEKIKTTYIWHGKEPLTAGIEFFQMVRNLQKPYEVDHNIRNSIQTNGVLLTPALADFFICENIDLGFSLDGPRWLHNQMRPYFNGKGSFDDTMRAINLLRDKGRHPGVIAVLTKQSLPHLDEIYDFFQNEGLNFKINPIFSCGNAIASKALLLSPDERFRAVTYLFDRWFFDKNIEHTSNYENVKAVIESIFLGCSRSCDMMANCQQDFISIGEDGTVFPCARFLDQELSFGNINLVSSFDEIISNSTRQKLLHRFENNKSCTDCEYNILCYAGCMHNAYLAGNIMGKDPNCHVYKLVFEHISTRIIEQFGEEYLVE